MRALSMEAGVGRNRCRLLAACVAFLVLARQGALAGEPDELGRLRGSLAAALQADDPTEASRMVTRIGALDDPKAVGLILSTAVQTLHPAVYEACTRAFSQTKSQAVVDELARFAAARGKPTASIAIETLAEVQEFDDAVRKPLVAAFLDLKDYPRSEAAQAMVLPWLRDRVRERWALRALIDLRKQLFKRKIADGRLYCNLIEALWAGTGQEYDNPEDWDKYWDTLAAQPEGAPPSPAPPAPGAPGAPDPGPPGADAGDGVTVGTTAVARRLPAFFGREIRSERAVFIIDVSSSMLDVDPGQAEVDEKEEEKVEPVTVEGKTSVKKAAKKARRVTIEPDFGEPGKRTRIQRVQRQLWRMIQTYPEGRHFAVVAFGTEVKLIIGQRKGGTYYPIRMTPETREEASEAVVALTAAGITRTDLAFETAFQFEGVNAIYLLSDGLPQRDPKLGSLPPAEQAKATEALMREVLTYVWKKNRVEGRHWEVHTLGFLRSNLGNFLGVLAKKNHGTFTPLR